MVKLIESDVKRMKLLLAEDDRDLSSIIVKLLEKNNYFVDAYMMVKKLLLILTIAIMMALFLI